MDVLVKLASGTSKIMTRGPRSTGRSYLVQQRLRALIFFLFFGLLFGCGQEQQSLDNSNVRAISYEPQEALSLEKRVLTDTGSIGNPSSIQKVGDYLLVADVSSAAPAHVLRADDGSYLTALGEAGTGPGEFRGIWSFDVVSDSLGTVWAYDLTSLRLTYVSLPRYVEGDYTLGDSLVTLDIGYTLTAPHWLGDSLLVSPGFLTEEGRLAYLDPQTGKTRRISGVSPPNPDGHPTAVVQHAYQASMADHPDEPLFALATRYADRIEIYRADGDRQMLIRGPDHFDPIYEVGTMSGEPVRASTDQTRVGYVDVEATASSIYALYSGRRRTEPHSGLGLFVHVLDWSGELQTVYKLDNPVVGIAVDESVGRLYATRHSPTPAVVSYDLNSPSDK